MQVSLGGEAASSSADIADDTTLRKTAVTTGAPHIFVILSATKTEDGSAIIQNGNKVSSSPTLGEAIDLLSGVDEPTLDDLSPQYKHSDSFQYGENRHIPPRPASSSNLGNSGGVLPINPLQHLNLPSSRGSTSASAKNSGVFDTRVLRRRKSYIPWQFGP